jgi:hypothetical protein
VSVETWYADAADADAGRNAENVIDYAYDDAGQLGRGKGDITDNGRLGAHGERPRGTHGTTVILPLGKPGEVAKIVEKSEEVVQALGKTAEIAGKVGEDAKLVSESGEIADGLQAVEKAITASEATAATRLTEAEQATMGRLEQKLGIQVSQSPHIGAEYVDALGRSYEQIGDPMASKFWNENKFIASIDRHLLKSNDFLVIDLTGFTTEQIQAVERYLATLPKETLDKIIRIGF